jgi:pyruvate dehydrogenase (quinone)
MPQTASDVFVDTLIDWGVEIIFGLPGDGINGVMEALRTRQDKIRFIQARHEEAAAFMAVAYAKRTGRLGVCLATTGPGGTHLLTGLYDAKFDRVPVLAITGLPYHDLIGTFTQQDIDHTKVFQDVAAYTTAIYGAQHVRQATALACRTALAERGVAHLAFPSDVQEQELEADKPSPRHKAEPTTAYAEGARMPTDEAVAKAAEVLNAGRKVAILAGQGALGAGEALLRTSELLGAPISKALLGKAVLPDDHPHVMGGVGYLGTRPSQQVFEACDTLLIVGSNFPYVEYYPAPGQARAVQIDLDARRIGLRYPVEAAVVGDARASLAALNEQHGQFTAELLQHDLGRILLDARIIGPLAGLDRALDIDRRTLAQILLGDLHQVVVEDHHAVPFGLFLALARGAVAPGFRGGAYAGWRRGHPS